jgi:hypothetical protein
MYFLTIQFEISDKMNNIFRKLKARCLWLHNCNLSYLGAKIRRIRVGGQPRQTV